MYYLWDGHFKSQHMICHILSWCSHFKAKCPLTQVWVSTVSGIPLPMLWQWDITGAVLVQDLEIVCYTDEAWPILTDILALYTDTLISFNWNSVPWYNPLLYPTSFVFIMLSTTQHTFICSFIDCLFLPLEYELPWSTEFCAVRCQNSVCIYYVK